MQFLELARCVSAPGPLHLPLLAWTFSLISLRLAGLVTLSGRLSVIELFKITDSSSTLLPLPCFISLYSAFQCTVKLIILVFVCIPQQKIYFMCIYMYIEGGGESFPVYSTNESSALGTGPRPSVYSCVELIKSAIPLYNHEVLYPSVGFLITITNCFC